jgi:hypothetical protein
MKGKVLMRRLCFTAAICFAMGVVSVVAFYAGLIVEALHCQGTSETVFTSGFENGVRCGVIAYTYDPSETDLPIITARARYWYVALLSQSKEPASPMPATGKTDER